MAFDDSTIAQFVFDRDPALNLGLLVSELDAALERSGAGRRSVTWDGDDLAFLDLDGARFTLSYTGETAPGLPSSLMLSVGPTPALRGLPPDPRHYHELCHLIADRLRARFAPRETLWHQVAGPVTADLVDDLFDRLPDLSGDIPAPPIVRRALRSDAIRAFPEADMPASFVEKAMAIRAAKAERARATAAQPARSRAPEPANSQPDLPRRAAPELDRVRTALYPQDEETPAENVRMRLAATTLDVTMLIVYLPMGAAMLTCSLLRGGNVTQSARMMALACTALGLGHAFGLGLPPTLSLL
ncbi:hypothetical protein GU927_016630 [Rhodobacteraceae bacterium HSP-20]|uniref:Uncharacterized protein n=1 Tax=Paragemmobacter amnigenus TaxID=2852097 RepID=A0ABS6J6T7_9RHOB|nr:hypothetical protein [Rhodobacter amnigenus]MBU9699473.1 hypothetical protein [Rhodobacter amnigenus]MBV4390700.1 hypothetical protein [Rhodobacter amnigenus]